MNIFGWEVSVKRKRPKNKILIPKDYAGSDFWKNIANAGSTNREMKIAAVFRCVDLLSDNISMLPWFSVNSKTHQKPEDPYTGQIWYLLNRRPNKNMTPAVFFKTIEQYRLNGNAYVEIIFSVAGIPESLLILNPDTVRPKKLDNGDVVYDVYDNKSFSRRLAGGDVLHFKNISDDGLIGKSVLGFASDCVNAMTHQEEFHKSFYENGGVLGGILELETDLAGKTMDVPEDHPLYGVSLKDAIRDDFAKHIKKSKGALKLALIDNGGKYKEIKPISQRDMAFVESKEVSISDIARFYGVPLYKLFTGKESYESNEQNNIAFVTDKLNPIITGYEQEITFKLLPYEKILEGIQIKANLNILLRGDSAARAKHYIDLRHAGALSANDIRGFEDLPAIEGGDEYLASKNYIPLKDFERLSDTGIAPAGGDGEEKEADNTPKKPSKSSHF